jgi:hypothetical protein
MKQNASRSIVLKIMNEFANRTGLSPASEAPRRYLWTDAFAVCNFLELNLQTGSEKYKNLALSLVDQVHNILGRHREDDTRIGWISGLDEQEGKIHPTKGGLRIGKEMSERRPGEPFDEQLEWHRDGQYYHYLTKWMHALNRVSRVTGDSTYNALAVELAKTVHARFAYVSSSGGPKRMYWKMNIDLSHPLVKSMGHHDPLDGFITYNQLQTTAKNSKNSRRPDLNAEIAELADICEGKDWATDDPLGLGGLLCDAVRVMQLIINENFEKVDLLEILLRSSLQGLGAYAKNNTLMFPAEYRLAFRELGLSIGLRAVDNLLKIMVENPEVFNNKHPLRAWIETMTRYTPLIEVIESFWLEPKNREPDSWTDLTI